MHFATLLCTFALAAGAHARFHQHVICSDDAEGGVLYNAKATEWACSTYAKQEPGGKRGKSCPDCHMTTVNDMPFCKSAGRNIDGRTIKAYCVEAGANPAKGSSRQKSRACAEHPALQVQSGSKGDMTVDYMPASETPELLARCRVTMAAVDAATRNWFPSGSWSCGILVTIRLSCRALSQVKGLDYVRTGLTFGGFLVVDADSDAIGRVYAPEDGDATDRCIEWDICRQMLGGAGHGVFLRRMSRTLEHAINPTSCESADAKTPPNRHRGIATQPTIHDNYNSCCSKVAPSAAEVEVRPIASHIKDFVVQKKDSLPSPAAARARLEEAGIDLSNGYPFRPGKPLYLDDATSIRSEDREYVDAGARADKSKSACTRAIFPHHPLSHKRPSSSGRVFSPRKSAADGDEVLSAAREVKRLTAHIGTEIVSLQLKDLTDTQTDELALLMAERSVVFFRGQDLSPRHIPGGAATTDRFVSAVAGVDARSEPLRPVCSLERIAVSARSPHQRFRLARPLQ
ncbi:unnamed protein product [Diplocarpon coronariae]